VGDLLGRKTRRISTSGRRAQWLALAGVACVVVSAFVLQASAAPTPTGPVISVQFTGYDGAEINSTNTAGVVSVADWNFSADMVGNQDNLGTYTSTTSNNGATLVNSTGANSGISYKYAYDRVSGTNANPFSFGSDPGDFRIAQEAAGVQGTNPATLTISGLQAGSTYDIIAYVGSMYFGGGAEAVTLGATTYYLTSSTTLTGWTQSVATTAGSATPGNYVEFDNLTGATSRMLTVPANGNAYGLGGIQIVPVAAVPEPASLALLGAAGPLILPRRRRA
jgi:hypothetical protein